MQTKVHGLRAVKLTDIPLQRRLSAARVVVKSLCDESPERVDVLAAAMFPSDKTYWIRVQAEWPEVLAA